MSYDLFVDTGHSIMYVGYGLLNKEYVTSHRLYCERLWPETVRKYGV